MVDKRDSVSHNKVNSMTAIGERLFVIRKNWPTQVEHDFSKIDTAISFVQKEFRNAIAKAFHMVHQRCAQYKDIPNTHKVALADLQGVHDQMVIRLNTARLAYMSIPVISNTKLQRTYLSDMYFLETITGMFLQKSEALQALLGDPKRASDLEYFKKKVAALDALADWGNLLDYLPFNKTRETKIAQLEALCNEVTGECAADNYLLIPLLRFMLYVAKQLQAQGVITIFQKRLAITDLEYPPNPQKNIRDLQQSLQTTSLLNEEKFRCNAVHVEAPAVGYRGIKPIMDDLELVEQSVKQAETALYERMRSACEKDSQVPAALLLRVQDHELVVNHWFNQLLQKPFFTETHAGWYYEDAVRIHARQVSECFKQFQGMLEGDFGLYCTSTKTLRAYLQSDLQAETVSRATKISLLYNAVSAASALQRPVSKEINAYWVIEQTIAQKGADLVGFTDDEKKIPQRVFRRAVSWKEHAEALQTYLMVGFLQNTHFADQRSQNYEFEAAYYMLSSDPAYCTGFKACLAGSEVFTKLHAAYLSQNERGKSVEELKKMNGMLIRLHIDASQHASEEAVQHELFVRMNTLEQKLASLNFPQFTRVQRMRLGWLSDQVTALKERCTLMDTRESSLSQLLYDALRKNLFSTNSDIRMNSEGDIKGLISLSTFTIDSVTGITRTLLLRWRLKKFVDEEKLSKEEPMLAALFIDYLTNADTKSFWRCQFDFGYLEIALRKYVECGKNKKAIVDARGDEKSLWGKMLNYYIEFRKIIDLQGGLVPESLYMEKATTLYVEAQALFLKELQDKIPEGENAVSISNALLIEMKQFITGERFVFAKEFLTSPQ